MSADLSEAVEAYVAAQRARKLEEVDKKLAVAPDPPARQALNERRTELVEAYRIDRWLDNAVSRVSQIRISTHAPKFAHPEVRGGGIHAMADPVPRPTEIGTHTLDAVQADIDGNAAVLDVGNLLLIENGGEALWRQVLDGNAISLSRFSDDAGRVRSWVVGLAAAVAPFSGRSHALAKQTYFPVEGGHHLISPQFASSLAHELYTRVDRSRFSDEAKEARKARTDRVPCPHDAVRYTSVARMKFGGSKPQNVSLLNSKRRGVVYLLDAAPPEWRARLALPVSGHGALWRLYARRSHRTFEALKGLLSRLDDHNAVEVRRRRQSIVAELVDRLLHLVAEIRLEGAAGWSRESDLPLAEQCLLDPGRAGIGGDGSFDAMVASGDWRAEVSRTFGGYVNRRLDGLRSRRAGRVLVFGDAEAAEWAKLLRAELARLDDDLEFGS